MKRVVAHARDKGLDVALGGEDSSRADLNFLIELIASAKAASARRFRLSDTLSLLNPDASLTLMAALRASTDLEFEFHGQDDLAPATADTLAAIKAGATHAPLTVIGLGERAGNGPLEEVAVALSQIYGRDTGVLLSELEKVAAAGAAAACPPFRSTSARRRACLDLDGLLKDRPAYQALDPGLLGRSHRIVIGEHCSFRSLPTKPGPFSRASVSMPSSTKARFPRKRWWRSGATFARARSSTEGDQVVSHALRAIRLEHSARTVSVRGSRWRLRMTMDGILSQLNKASAAEEFFAVLGVEYDAKIIDVARLHILRRMGEYLAGEEFTGASDPDIASRCKATLERAYADFVTSSPIEQRVFKVLKNAAAPQSNKQPALVQLSSFE
ncbi:hypothetical protein ABIA95_004113 [Bradyrhizobium sp. LA8.1]